MKIQWLFLVPVKGGLGGIVHPPEGKDYKWYISGIFPAKLGDYMLPTTFYGNQKQPLSGYTPRKFTKPLKLTSSDLPGCAGPPKGRKIVFQRPSIFSCENVSFREGNNSPLKIGLLPQIRKAGSSGKVTSFFRGQLAVKFWGCIYF